MIFRIGQWLYGNLLNGTKRDAELFINFDMDVVEEGATLRVILTRQKTQSKRKIPLATANH